MGQKYDNLSKAQFEKIIKPCPFCGSKKITMYEFGVVPDPHIRCDTCGAQTTEHHTRTEAILSWNSRVGRKKVKE